MGDNGFAPTERSVCSDSEKKMSACADQNHAPSLTCVRLESRRKPQSPESVLVFLLNTRNENKITKNGDILFNMDASESTR